MLLSRSPNPNHTRQSFFLIVGGKFTVFAMFYFAFEGNFQVQAPGGLIFGGACTWRGLFSEFYGICFAPKQKRSPVVNSTSTCVS